MNYGPNKLLPEWLQLYHRWKLHQNTNVIVRNQISVWLEVSKWKMSIQQPSFSFPPDGWGRAGVLCAGILVQRNVFPHTQWLVMGTVQTTCNCSLERALSLIVATCRSVEMARLMWKYSTSEGFPDGLLQAQNWADFPIRNTSLPPKYSFIEPVSRRSIVSDLYAWEKGKCAGIQS